MNEHFVDVVHFVSLHQQAFHVYDDLDLLLNVFQDVLWDVVAYVDDVVEMADVDDDVVMGYDDADDGVEGIVIENDVFYDVKMMNDYKSENKNDIWF